MTLLIISFMAGVLTVLAPCILPLLPIIVGGASVGEQRPAKPFIIAMSLAVSVVLFTLLLKFSTALLGIPPSVWQVMSGFIVIVLGVTTLWPGIWEKAAAKLNITTTSWLGKAGRQKGVWGDIVTGAALGPVFNSCSPTYAFIVAGVLPVSFVTGFAYLLAYAVGLASVLLLIALFGQKVTAKLGWATNPHGWFKRILGGIFILVGLAVATGADHYIQTYLVQNGWYDAPTQFENSFLTQ